MTEYYCDVWYCRKQLPRWKERRNTPKLLLPIIIYSTAEREDVLLRGTCTRSQRDITAPGGGRRGVIPVARIKARGTGTSRRALKMKRGICDRAGAHCRVPVQRCLIGKIIFPLINNEYDLSNKILCMFRFNGPSFRKGSILPGTSSNLVWLTSAGS